MIPMKLKCVYTGVVITCDDEVAQRFVASGGFEYLEAEAETAEEAEAETAEEAEVVQPKATAKRTKTRSTKA